MRGSFLLPALAASSVSALAIQQKAGQLYTIELAPGETKQVTEAEKWQLRQEGKHFFDVSEFSDFTATANSKFANAAAAFPAAVAQTTAVKALLPKLDKTVMQSNLKTFSEFNNRYYKAATGKQSSEWLLGKVNAAIASSGAKGVTAKAFAHNFGQSSIIATIPGKSAKIVAVGAHQDSINLKNPTSGRAPGADDDGSGSIVILEAMRALLTDPTIASGGAANTIEFHWYAAEEAGLLGSQAIFQSYSRSKKQVVAMLNQDMTGYVKPGTKPAVGVMTDFVDVPLTNFIKKVVTAYCTIPFVETKCGYACSDHASASKAGYPSAFVTESKFEDSNKQIHTELDTVDKVDFEHSLEHAKMTVGLAYELGMATL